MQITPQIVEDYYIIFTESKHDHWMVKHLKAPFQHVYAVKKSDGGKFWIKIDPATSALIVTMHPVYEYPHIKMLVGEEDIVLPVRAIIRDKERWTFCIINCVEIVKALLGIRAFWVWTPRQLYKYLTGGNNEQAGKRYRRLGQGYFRSNSKKKGRKRASRTAGNDSCA